MKTLIIETCTERGVVAIAENGGVVAAEELPFGLQNSRLMLPVVDRMLEGERAEAIIVGVGPGSYTGIRIGAVAAKTLAFVWRVPIYPVCTLQSLLPEGDSASAAVIDAKMSGVYFYRSGGVAEVCSLEELGERLQGLGQVITPNAQSLKPRIESLYGADRWHWIEKAPNPSLMLALGGKTPATTHVDLQLRYLRGVNHSCV